VTAHSRALADAYASADVEALPATVTQAAQRALLDWLGSTLAGSCEPPARMARRVAVRLGHSDDATVFGGRRMSAAAAAFANGVSAHILEFDDVHRGSTLHAAAPIVSAALAVAEREHASGRAFLGAVVLGYDAAFRIGEAVNPSHYRMWHPTGTVATFGAAVAAGSLIKLGSASMLDAIGSAGTQAAGLWEFNADSTMSKHLHPGKAALNGILAADLAQEGFTGARTILEGNRGLIRAMSNAEPSDAMLDELGRRWKITENTYKVWPCCGHTHTAIDVARELRAQNSLTPDRIVRDVTAIEIETYGPGYEIVKESHPRAPYTARFSIAYCTAATLIHDGAPETVFSADNFDRDGVRDAAVARLLARTSVTVAADLTVRYPAAWPARLRITLRDGSVLRGEADFPVGSPEKPISTDGLREKFRAMVAPRWGDETVTRALAAVDAIPTASDMALVFGGSLQA
jgi:2-methylcitrate dehydratase PrpD